MLPFKLELEIRFGDVDALGHLNNVAYYRFLEQARVRFMLAVKGSLTGDAKIDFPYVVAHSELDFKAPLKYDDRCVVTMGVADIKTTSFTFVYELYGAKNGSLAAKGKVVMVCFDHDKGVKTPIPQFFRDAIEKYSV